MSYFYRLPELFYNFPIKGRDTLFILRDITVNFRILKDALDNVVIYEEYDVVDGETPEIVSQKLYGTPRYHWVIMMANERYDYIKDWVLPYDRLEQYCKDKYGDEEVFSTHHYEDSDGYVVDSDTALATPISNLDYESKINESKRRIKVISLSVIQALIQQYTSLTA